MTIVITMAGLGTRFKVAGYATPKYMIEVQNKTLFEWSMLSLTDFWTSNNDWIFIVRKEDNSSAFISEQCKKLGIENVKIVELFSNTDGQATTALKAEQYWDKNSELLIYNIDTYIEKGGLLAKDLKGEGFIPCFKGKGDHWSFVKLDDKGRAIKVTEKIRISEYCSLGAYYFKSCKLYEKLYEEYYKEKNNLVNGEKYIAPLYNYLIQKKGEVYISDIDVKKIHVLGTPEELEDFKKGFKNE